MIDNREHKVSLYTVDMVIYFTNPASSLQVALNVLEEFGFGGGLRMNKEKSEIYPIHLRDDTFKYLCLSFKLTWAFKYWRYLGIWFPIYIEEIAKYNYDWILSQIGCVQISQLKAVWGQPPLGSSARASGP